MGKELDHMLKRFPQYRGLVMQLFASHEDFKSICEDYWACTTNIDNLKADHIYDQRMLSQYNLLKLELETEALRLLTAFSNQQEIH